MTGTSDSVILHLYLAHMSRRPEELFGTLYWAVARLYADTERPYTERPHHMANLRAQNKFRLLAMKNLYPTNRAQRKAMNAIIKLQSMVQSSLLDFPNCDVGRAIGLMPRETPTTYDQVLGCHGALISQLRNFLRGQA